LKERQHLLALIRVWGLFAALYGRGAFKGSHSSLFGFVGWWNWWWKRRSLTRGCN